MRDMKHGRVEPIEVEIMNDQGEVLSLIQGLGGWTRGYVKTLSRTPGFPNAPTFRASCENWVLFWRKTHQRPAPPRMVKGPPKKQPTHTETGSLRGIPKARGKYQVVTELRQRGLSWREIAEIFETNRHAMLVSYQQWRRREADRERKRKSEENLRGSWQ